MTPSACPLIRRPLLCAAHAEARANRQVRGGLYRVEIVGEIRRAAPPLPLVMPVRVTA